MVDTSKDYIGRVVYNQDNTFSGRCKIQVYGVFDELEIEDMPWIYPKTSSVFSSANGFGSISVPKIGSIVRVNFHNDVYSGEYSSIQNIDPALIDEIKDDYENTHVLLYDSDKELIVIYQPMTGYKMSLGGSMIKIDSDGSIQLKHRNNSNVVELTENKINITTASDGGTETNGEINISAGATINITAPVVNVNSPSISLGKNSTSRAVKGEKLIKVLQTIAIELDSKFPQGASTLKGRNFSEILSDTVTLN